MVDEIEPKASPLTLFADRRVRQPDGRDELVASELGEDPGVEIVGLGGERGEALGLGGVGDLDIPTGELELIVDEAGPFIDSMAASIGWPNLARWRASVRSASASGRTASVSTVRPSGSRTWTSSFWRERSNPAYNMGGPSWCWFLGEPTFSPEALFMAFSSAPGRSASSRSIHRLAERVHPSDAYPGGPFTIVATDGVGVPEQARFEKDTVNVGPRERYDVVWTAREPERWLLHCHINDHVTNDNVEEGGGGGLMLILDVAP